MKSQLKTKEGKARAKARRKLKKAFRCGEAFGMTVRDLEREARIARLVANSRDI